MTLFSPSHFPICYADGGIARIPLANLDEVEKGVFKEPNRQERHSLYEALQASMSNSINDVLYNFSNFTDIRNVELTIGNTNRIELKLPNGCEVFAAPLPAAVMGDSAKGIHCFPSLFHMGEDALLVGTTAHQTHANPIGETVRMMIFIHCYFSKDAYGWKRVLYSALSNLSQHNTNIAVILLTTAVELYCDHLFRKYLQTKDISEVISEHTVNSARSWHVKAERTLKLFMNFVDSANKKEFAIARNLFESDAKKIRNNFAHEHAKDITIPKSHSAFCSAFPLLWQLDRIDDALDRMT